MTRLTLLHYSGEFTDPGIFIGSDAAALLRDHQPLMLSTTEASDRHLALQMAANLHGYQLVQPLSPQRRTRRTECAILIHPDALVLKEWAVPGIPADGRRPSQGGHGPRDITLARVRYAGERATLGVFHRLTTPPGPERTERQTANARLDRLVATTLRREAQGLNLAFAACDANDDAREWTLRGMTPAWRELGTYGRTGPGGGCIDMHLARDNDTRVRCSTVKALPRMHPDHAPVLTTYDVTPRPRARSRGR